MLIKVESGLDILNLSKGDSITRGDLYNAIINSKNKDFYKYSPEYIINNTPMQGINWIGYSENLKAVIIKSNSGKYKDDGDNEYAFKAKNNIVDKNETANAVLINQPKFNYPILYFVRNISLNCYELQQICAVKEIKEKSVILKPWEGILTDTEIKSIEDIPSIQGEEKESTIKIRINQSLIRKNALRKYNCKCVLCGLTFEPALIASHIKGWKDSTKIEKGDIDNILLLCSNHDSLFDKHYISFNEDGNIVISDKIKNEERELLNISSSMKLNIPIPMNMKKYLAFHRNQLK